MPTKLLPSTVARETKPCVTFWEFVLVFPSAFFRRLVEVWIPSVIKKGRGPDGHHVYQVDYIMLHLASHYIIMTSQVLLKVGPEEWNVYRRYAEFREFHRQLLKHVPDANSFSFPPKRALGNKVQRQ